MDMTLLGETTAKMMDAIERNPRFDEDTSLLAIGIVVILEGKDSDGDPMTFTRTFCSEDYHYRQVGVFEAGLETIKDGSLPDED